jgi:O-antigen/teichoic acid export membrane protein
MRTAAGLQRRSEPEFETTTDEKPSRRFGGATEVLANVGLRGATLVAKVGITIAIARLIGSEALGLYGLLTSAVAFAVFAAGLEYHYFTRRELILGDPEKRATIVRDQQLLQLVAVVILLGALMAYFRVTHWTAIGENVRIWFYLLVLVELVSQELSQNLIALARPVAANIVFFVRMGLWTYPIVALFMITPAFRTISWVFGGWIVGGCLSVVIAVWCLRDLAWSHAFSDPIDWKEMRRGIRTAAPYIVITGSSMGLLFLDRFIVGGYKGLAAVGIYTFFVGIATSVHTIVNTGVSVIRMPYLVEAYQKKTPETFRRELSRMTSMTVSSSLVLMVAAAIAIFPALRLAGKPAYYEHLGAFFILLVAAGLRCVADVPIYALYAKRRDLWIMWVELGAFAASVVLNLCLVPRYSIEGAATAACIAALLLLGSAIGANLVSDAAVALPLRGVVPEQSISP